MLFQVQGFCKRFGDLAALTDVSFQVRAGEILGLLGPNGAGKSTLFECLAGVLPRDRGEVLGESGVLPPAALHRLYFYVPDGIAPYSDQPLDWVLSYVTGFFGGHRATRQELIEQLELTGLLRQPIGVLSKGQRKRALLAVGLLTPQPALLIDEPFDGLDLRQTRDVAGVLRTWAQRGRTLVLSIHQIADAARICDRFVLLSGGRVRGEGTIPELATRAGLPTEQLEEVFLALT